MVLDKAQGVKNNVRQSSQRHNFEAVRMRALVVDRPLALMTSTRSYFSGRIMVRFLAASMSPYTSSICIYVFDNDEVSREK